MPVVEPISYTLVQSPWGALLLAGSEKAIYCCRFLGTNEVGASLAYLQQHYGPVQLKEDARPLTAAICALEGYFAGEVGGLRHPVQLGGTPFQLKVWAILREIPPGQVATYGEVAARLGRPRSARAVGQACGSNPVALFVPCHRVVASGGKLGGFSCGIQVKVALLRHEGWLAG
ncbi:MAG TPA: methylated-DNA--[protein]-cysteine S-methyltransferase [Syntrophobacteria bacterium]|nr:methylated-DNA--[protein]-cysteine S-methyltransferase [Syntrophobacteria bacterium]